MRDNSAAALTSKQEAVIRSLERHVKRQLAVISGKSGVRVRYGESCQICAIARLLATSPKQLSSNSAFRFNGWVHSFYRRSGAFHMLQNTRCRRVMDEMKKHPYSCAAEQAELVRQLDAAVTLGKAALHDCRRGEGRHDGAGANQRLRLYQLQASERQRHVASRLDVVLHTNLSLRERIANMRDTVLQDREHCNTLLQRHTAVVEAASQYTKHLQLENDTNSVARIIRQTVDSMAAVSQVPTHYHGTKLALHSWDVQL